MSVKIKNILFAIYKSDVHEPVDSDTGRLQQGEEQESE